MIEQTKLTFDSGCYKKNNSIDKTFSEGLANAIDFVDEQINKRIQGLHILSEKAIRHGIATASNILLECISSGGKVLIAGNGGSAAQSQHFSAELMGRMKTNRNPFSAISLSSDVSCLTCIANDFGFERIFSRQIEGIGCCGDVFVCITTSGKSRNLLEAINVCKEKKIRTIIITGALRNDYEDHCDCVIKINHDDVCLIQEIQMQIIHIICENIEAQILSSRKCWSELLNIDDSRYNSLILDRDGVVNHVKANGYVQNVNELVLNSDFCEYAKEIAKKYEYIFIATNQKGVGKGIMTQESLDAIHTLLIEKIKNIGGRIDKIYTCTSTDEKNINLKPNIGMAEQIKHDFPHVVFDKTIVVGDSNSDRLFADNIGAKFVYAETR